MNRPALGAAALRTLAAIRLVNGALALVAPGFLVRRTSGHPESTDPYYAFRMFGIRTVLLGADLLLLTGEGQARARDQAVLIHAADTVVAVGRRILPKVEDEATLRACMALLSGRRHRVLTGVALAIPGQPTRSRLVETMIAIKRLSAEEVDYYASHGEWRGKAGGYALQGYGEVYVRHIAGSYSNVVGLPLAETRHLLKSAGYSLA